MIIISNNCRDHWQEESISSIDRLGHRNAKNIDVYVACSSVCVLYEFDNLICKLVIRDYKQIIDDTRHKQKRLFGRIRNVQHHIRPRAQSD